MIQFKDVSKTFKSKGVTTQEGIICENSGHQL